jgi:hypothetical protein
MSIRIQNFLLIAAVTVCLAIIPDGSAGQAAPEGPLLFRIVLPHSTVCTGARQLETESELRNISGRPISLSPAGIRGQIQFTNRPSSLEDGFRSNGITADPPPNWTGKTITLAPGGSYRRILKLELAPDFFTDGIYRMQIEYSGAYGGSGHKGVFTGSIASNEVLFEIRECASPSAALNP